MACANRQPLSGVWELPTKSPKYGNAVVPKWFNTSTLVRRSFAPLRGAHTFLVCDMCLHASVPNITCSAQPEVAAVLD